MLFGLESDTGDRILFYLVPDTYTEVAEVKILAGGVEILDLAANEMREAISHAGRHETGRCGFRIDTELVPALATLADLSVHEKKSGILIYRRPQPDRIQRKLLRVETAFLPLIDFDKSIMTHFQFTARQIEHLGHETVTQMFLVSNIDSIYLSGRVLVKNYLYFLEGNFETIICLDDPYYSIAERLIILDRLHKSNTIHVLSPRDAVLLKPAAAFAADLTLTNGKDLRRALRNLPLDVAVALVNPLTRLLTATTPDEMPRRGAVASAFDFLASCSVVGIRKNAAYFREAVGVSLNREPSALPVPTTVTMVENLAALLRQEAQIEGLIESDLQIYTQVCDAHEKVA